MGARGRIAALVVAVVAPLVPGVAFAPPAAAVGVTFTVNSSADPGTGTCDATECTLREAIVATNAAPGSTIQFSIGSGAQTITLASSLPTVTAAVTIDGATQPGYAGAPLIEIDAVGSGGGTFGLFITAGSSTVRALAVNRAASPGGIGLWSAGGNTIEDSYVGLGLDGTTDRGNAGDGIVVAAGSSSNRIAGNVISGNAGSGIWLRDDQGPANSNIVQGNLIGTDAAGTSAVKNDSAGIAVYSSSNQIGGITAAERNVVSGNGTGLRVGNGPNTVEGNFIGLDITGATALKNSLNGVDVVGSGSTIGGPAGHGNVVAGNGQEGIQVTGATNQILGNLVGLDSTGTVSLGNGPGFRGVNIAFSGATGNTVADNTIAGHSIGVQIAVAGTGNVLRANRIGTDVTGALARPNQTGVQVYGTTGAVLGGTTPGDGNTIAFNSSRGVLVSSSATSVEIVGNSIYANTSLGIDLSSSNFADGVTGNDAGDGDAGGNNLQNFPVITSASSDGATTAVGGTLSSEASTAYRIELFANPACHSSGNGEGKRFIGAVDATTNGSGDAAFATNLPGGLAVDEVVTATATAPNGSTSEFSGCVTASVDGPSLTVNIAADSDDGACTIADCSLREAINRSNTLTGTNTIDFNISGGGVPTISPTSALPVITNPVVIDGGTSSACAGTPGVILDGALAGSGSSGLDVTGGGTTVRGMVISSWGQVGIRFWSNGNTAQCNRIGTNAAGTAAAGNRRGVEVNGNGNLIGGTGAGEGNLVSGNTLHGIDITGLATTGNRVEGNKVGTDLAGTTSIGNGMFGVLVGGVANVVGGGVAAARNVISGNVNDGVRLPNGSSDHRIEGNWIGVDAVLGTTIVANGANGVFINGVPAPVAGGNVITGNVIGGNRNSGVQLSGPNAQGNTIENNLIGVGADGTTAVRNGPAAPAPPSSGWGVIITGPNNVVRGNTIAHNGTGVQVGTSVASTEIGVTISRNSIFANGGLGIDLAGDGVTTNDALDVDAGPNTLQNVPEIASATADGPSTTVVGSLHSSASTTFEVELFGSPECGGDHTQGKTYLGSTSVTTDGSGDAVVTASVAPTSAGDVVTATATAPDGSTSELSACMTVQSPPATTGTIIVEKQTLPDGDPTVFELSGAITGTISDGETITAVVEAGDHTVTEAMPAVYWLPSSIRCDDDDSTGSTTDRSATFRVAPGETVRCVFTNRGYGRVRVGKTSLPAGGTGFEFVQTVGTNLPSDPYPINDGQTLGGYGPAGLQRVFTEVPKAGWRLVGVDCGGNPRAVIDGSSVTFNPAVGDDILCTFTNEQMATIIIDKVTTPTASSESFDFRLTGPESTDHSFSLTDAAAPEAVEVPPGTGYAVVETPLTGWAQTAATCSDGSAIDAIDVSPGETVTCTVTNTAVADLALDKIAPATASVGGLAAFSVVVSNSGPGDAGAFTVVDDLPAGTTFDVGSSDARCSESSGTVTCAAAGLASGQQTTFAVALQVTVCGTLTNDASIGVAETPDPSSVNNTDTAAVDVPCDPARGRIIVDKVTIPSTATQSFDFTLTGGPSPGVSQSFALTAAAAPYDSGALVAGSGYNLAESGALGWQQTGATCDDGSPLTNITLSPGETVTCTVTNTSVADLRVTKSAPNLVRPNDNGFMFFPTTITVTNDGPGLASDVVISDDLPDNAVFVSVDAGSAVSCTGGDPTICTVPLLAPGSSVVVTVVERGRYYCTSVTDTAAVTSSSIDPVAANNSASATADMWTVRGTGDADVLYGTAENDVICGLSGADSIAGLGGRDVLLGQSEVDTVFYSWVTTARGTEPAGVEVNLAAGAANSAHGTEDLSSIENVVGSRFRDRITGSGARNVLSGADDADDIVGGPASDDIRGEEGDDNLSGGDGSDEINGGPGSDLVLGGDNGDVLFGGAGDDEIRAGLGNDFINAGMGRDSVFGDSGADRIFGDVFNPTNSDLVNCRDVTVGDSDFQLAGGDGNDLICGQGGNDNLNGNAGSDTLYGGPGADVLHGGSGQNSLFGGTGFDTCSFGPKGEKRNSCEAAP